MYNVYLNTFQVDTSNSEHLHKRKGDVLHIQPHHQLMKTSYIQYCALRSKHHLSFLLSPCLLVPVAPAATISDHVGAHDAIQRTPYAYLHLKPSPFVMLANQRALVHTCVPGYMPSEIRKTVVVRNIHDHFIETPPGQQRISS